MIHELPPLLLIWSVFLPSPDTITFPPSAKLRRAVRQCGHRPRGTEEERGGGINQCSAGQSSSSVQFLFWYKTTFCKWLIYGKCRIRWKEFDWAASTSLFGMLGNPKDYIERSIWILCSTEGRKLLCCEQISVDNWIELLDKRWFLFTSTPGSARATTGSLPPAPLPSFLLLLFTLPLLLLCFSSFSSSASPYNSHTPPYPLANKKNL